MEKEKTYTSNDLDTCVCGAGRPNAVDDGDGWYYLVCPSCGLKTAPSKKPGENWEDWNFLQLSVRRKSA